MLRITRAVRGQGRVPRLLGGAGRGVFSERGALGRGCRAEFRRSLCPVCTASLWLTVQLLSVFGSGLQLCVGGRFSRKIFDYAEEIF